MLAPGLLLMLIAMVAKVDISSAQVDKCFSQYAIGPGRSVFLLFGVQFIIFKGLEHSKREGLRQPVFCRAPMKGTAKLIFSFSLFAELGDSSALILT